MLDKINEIFSKVKNEELNKCEAISELESMIVFSNETEDNLLLALAVARLLK